MRRIISNTIVQNAFFLYLVKVSNVLIPIVSVPYLARTLGTSRFGIYAAALSFGILLSIVVEYGFSISATRDVSKNRLDTGELSRIAGSVYGAKLFLCLIVMLIGTCVPFFVQILNNKMLAYAACFFACSIGLTPTWYFQGIEQLKLFSAIDVIGKFLGLGLIFIFVKSNKEVELALICQGVGASFGTIIGSLILFHKVPMRLPHIQDCISGLKWGFSMFFFRVSISLYTMVNVFILGLFETPEQVAYFAGAERLVRGISSGIGPISQAIFPRMSKFVHTDKIAAVRLLKITLFILLSGAVAVSIIIAIYSPIITQLFLGDGFDKTSRLIRGLVWIIPLIVIGNVFGIQWMLALRLDKQFNSVVVVVGLVNLTLSLISVPSFGSWGLVFTNLFSETLVVVLVISFLLHKRSFPLKMNLLG